MSDEAWEFVAYHVNWLIEGDERTSEQLFRDDYAVLVAWARERGLATSPLHYTTIVRS